MHYQKEGSGKVQTQYLQMKVSCVGRASLEAKEVYMNVRFLSARGGVVIY